MEGSDDRDGLIWEGDNMAGDLEETSRWRMVDEFNGEGVGRERSMLEMDHREVGVGDGNEGLQNKGMGNSAQIGSFNWSVRFY